MSESGPKLSRFKRLLGGLGKRIYNWRETKEPMNFLSYMYETIIEEYADIFNGDYEKSIEFLIELVRPMTEELIAKLLTEVKVLGVPFSDFLTQNVNDLPYIVETVLYAIFGSWARNVYEKPILVPAARSEQHVDEIVVRYNKCPFCCNTTIPPEKMGKERYGKFTCLTFEQCIQLAQDYVGKEVTVVGRETRCFHQGDTIGEMRFWIYPNDQLQLMESNEYLKKLK
jgi:hypothetical protein